MADQLAELVKKCVSIEGNDVLQPSEMEASGTKVIQMTEQHKTLKVNARNN